MREKENWLNESEVGQTNAPFYKKLAYRWGLGRLAIYITNRSRLGEKMFVKFFNPLIR